MINKQFNQILQYLNDLNDSVDTSWRLLSQKQDECLVLVKTIKDLKVEIENTKKRLEDYYDRRAETF